MGYSVGRDVRKLSDETIKIPHSFEERVFVELSTLGSRVGSLEDRVGSLENKVASLEDKIVKIDWDSFRRDFSKHTSEVKELFGDLDRKFDVMNHELLGLKAEQIRVEKRIDKIELDIRPHG
jgi:chromosome segregation ATPase